ncbi:hypothetical protein PLICRDRAFT_41156 [Plicaturopsis crispa FD-325 SS-3]|nr:hypothetical protein PLICRDRAFT_41156 [Plicaturopsis crispa FD-325 SS-3]
MKLKKWLKSGVLSDFPTSFEEADQKYTWRVNPIGHIALYAEDDPKAPIAWFTPSRKRIVDGAPVQVPASVALQPRGEEIQELVLASLLVVELRARNVRRGQAVAAGRAALTAASAGFPGF